MSNEQPNESDLAARLDKLLSEVTKDTFSRAIHIVAKWVVQGLEEFDTAMALVDTGRRVGLTPKELDALPKRLGDAISGIRRLGDAMSDEDPKASGSKASALVKLARGLFDFSLDDRGLVASPKDGGELLHGNDIQDQLAAAYHDMTGTTPTTSALKDALRVLAGDAQRQAPPVEKDTFDDIPDETGAELLNELVKFISRYLILPSRPCAHAMALWALHTWAIDSFVVSPRLIFRSVSKRCGKSRALEVLHCLCRDAGLSILPSAAVIYRLTQQELPTWLLDEHDNLMHSNPDSVSAITAVLNSGYRRGVTVPRMERCGDEWVTARYSIFAPVALAGIGNLLDTTEDRSVVIDIQRKLKVERTSKFHIVRTYNAPETITLRRRCAAWAKRHGEVLAVAEPKVPAVLDDRAAECWETLMAVAAQAGGRWPKWAEEAAKSLSAGRNGNSESLQMALLTDLQTLWATDKHFRDNGAPRQRMPSEDICTGLEGLEESEWDRFNKGDPITPASLAKLLRPFQIHSYRFRVEDGYRGADDGHGRNVRGYLYGDFEPIWERLLPPFKQDEVLGDSPERGV